MIQARKSAAAAMTALALSACVGPSLDLADSSASGPGGVVEAACFATETLPAVVETVTEQVLVQPAQLAADGTVITPAIYRSQARQAIVRKRQQTSFDVPCEQQMSPEFVATLQRALKARGYFSGPITGAMDRATRRAVAGYQTTLGLPSPVLSIEAARRLGLVVDRRDEELAAAS